MRSRRITYREGVACLQKLSRFTFTGVSTRRIAQLAGVSPTTVSLALHNSPKIPAETKQRVIKIARRLGYRPNARVAELMAHMRLKRDPQREACFGVISFYDNPRP